MSDNISVQFCLHRLSHKLCSMLQSHKTYTCSLLHSVQDVLGWDQKVQQAPQGVSLIATVNDLEELAEKGGGGGLKGRVQHRQQVLD